MANSPYVATFRNPILQFTNFKVLFIAVPIDFVSGLFHILNFTIALFLGMFCLGICTVV